jgi:hypothetical protein
MVEDVLDCSSENFTPSIDFTPILDLDLESLTTP